MSNMPAMQHLKNYFVPHEGNGFKPAALKPKRLLFHAIGAVAVKTVVFAVISSFPLSAWISSEEAAGASRQIIASTNEVRASIGLSALVENSKLNQAASQKVEDMFLAQYFAHVSPSGKDVATFLKQVGYEYSIAGENLAMGFSSVDGVMSGWKKSPTHYANIIDPNFKEIGVANAGGRLNGDDTALVAQYFGRPVQSSALVVAQPAKIIELDQTKTVLSVKGTVSGPEKVLNVETKLPAGTASADAVVNGVKMALAPTSSPDTWQGNAVITAEAAKQLTQPIVPAAVEIKSADGQLVYADLDWTEIKPIKASAFEQYAIFKSNPSAGMRSVLSIGNIYIIILLAVIGLASLLSILIEVKKQHPRVILSSLGAVAALVILLLI